MDHGLVWRLPVLIKIVCGINQHAISQGTKTYLRDYLVNIIVPSFKAGLPDVRNQTRGGACNSGNYSDHHYDGSICRVAARVASKH